jgi:predicted Mrr-cat superfamily restriction endonuclease
MVRAWLVRSEDGTGLETFEAEGFVGIRGGAAEPQVVDEDLSGADEQTIAGLVAQAGLRGHYTGMLRRIATDMEVGDLVVSPGPRDDDEPVVAVGRVASDYVFRGSSPMRHRREVRWERRVPRSAFPTGFWSGKRAALSEIDPRAVPEVGGA